jgi:hypothetical protein
MGIGHDDTISKILSEPDNHMKNIVRLSTICKVKITFHCSQSFPISRKKRVNNVISHVFPQFFSIDGKLYYMFKRGGRSGYPISMDNIQSYEPVISSAKKFSTFEEFKKQFDLYFITEGYIKTLWEETSPQHGGKYQPSDFKSVSKFGREALSLFLRRFKGINNTDTGTYTHRTFNGDEYWTVSSRYYGNGGSSTSRDISVSHRMGSPIVCYASEYHGTENGTYGILVSRSKYLWIEND